MSDPKATVKLNDDGTVTCRNCQGRIAFLPVDHMPDAGPNSVNHTGCPAAVKGESPAGPNLDGLHETINLIDRADLEDWYANRGGPERRKHYDAQQATAQAATADTATATARRRSSSSSSSS
jgi:hypothetical protein